MKKYTIDLGKIKHDSTHHFTITLDDNIVKAVASCGCTDIKYVFNKLSGTYQAPKLTKQYTSSDLFKDGYLEIQKTITVTHTNDEKSIITITGKVIL